MVTARIKDEVVCGGWKVKYKVGSAKPRDDDDDDVEKEEKGDPLRSLWDMINSWGRAEKNTS